MTLENLILKLGHKSHWLLGFRLCWKPWHKLHLLQVYLDGWATTENHGKSCLLNYWSLLL